MRLRIQALMNDTEATLLSHAYGNPSTRMSLIWGTGINVAVMLPLTPFENKLRQRPNERRVEAQTVLVNTEASMFGAGILPITSVDAELDELSDHPGFQPLEQLTSGRYLGEIIRLFLIRAIEAKALPVDLMSAKNQVRFAIDAEEITELDR